MQLEIGRITRGPSPSQRILLGLCGLLAVSASLCLYLGVRGFAPVVGLGGLFCLPFARIERRDWPGLAILAALVVWASISIAWSPAANVHVHSFKDVTRLPNAHLALDIVLCAAFVTGFARLEPGPARKGLAWIAYAMAFVELVLLVDGLCHAALYQFLVRLVHEHTRDDFSVRALAQGGYAAAVATWPLGMALHRRGQTWLAVALAAFMPLSLVILRGFAPTAAFAFSLPVFWLVQRFGRRAVAVLAILTVAYILLTPLAMVVADHAGVYARFKDSLPPSWADRLRIWSFVAERLGEHPLRGAGLDASRTYPDIVPLHPHNGPLQLLFELGVPGLLLGMAFWVWLWRRIADCTDRNRLYGAVASATAMVYLGIGAVGFGLWQEWWICVGAFAMALCIMFSRTIERPAAA